MLLAVFDGGDRQLSRSEHPFFFSISRFVILDYIDSRQQWNGASRFACHSETQHMHVHMCVVGCCRRNTHSICHAPSSHFSLTRSHASTTLRELEAGRESGVDGGAPQLGKEFAGRREISRADARVTPMGQAFRLVLLLCYFFFFFMRAIVGVLCDLVDSWCYFMLPAWVLFSPFPADGISP